MSRTPRPSGISPDTRAVISAAEELTMQVRRIANALTTPVAVIRDGVLTSLADTATVPATTCSAQYMKHAKLIRNCIRAAHHIGTGQPHTAEQGFCWSDITAVYPAGTRAPVVCNEPGPWDDAHSCIRRAGHTDDHEADDGCGWRTGMCDTGQHKQHPGFTCAEVDQSRPYWNARWEQEQQSPATDDVTCRRMETRICPPSYGRPCGERPCARFESDDPTPWLDTSADEASYYRQLSAEQGQALSRAEASRAEAQRDRDQHAAVLREVLATFVHKVEGYRIPRVRSGEVDVVTLDKWRSVVAPTVERPWWETVTELRAELEQLRALAPMLDGLHTLIATSSRDWQTYRVDAWIWAVLCGWDCEQAEHDETCTHGALAETAAMHGWDDATVAKARRYRAAVRAVIALDESRQAPAQVSHPETNPQASGSPTVDEQPGHVCPDVQQASTEVRS